jgi:hypothetical protein
MIGPSLLMRELLVAVGLAYCPAAIAVSVAADSELSELIAETELMPVWI